MIAHDTLDTVDSSWLVRGADGKEYKPQDYLTAFSEFVRQNPAQVEAIRILLGRPRDWSTEALTELQQTLAATPQRFTLAHLRKAHELHYHKALIDIISMVKHAANEEQPLYTASERVQLAIARMSTGKAYTPEQIQWLNRIEGHLVENLTIDQDDFDALPIYENGTVPILATEQFKGLNGWDASTAKLVNQSFHAGRVAAHGFRKDDIVFARKGRLGFGEATAKFRQVRFQPYDLHCSYPHWHSL